MFPLKGLSWVKVSQLKLSKLASTHAHAQEHIRKPFTTAAWYLAPLTAAHTHIANRFAKFLLQTSTSLLSHSGSTDHVCELLRAEGVQLQEGLLSKG